MSVYLMGATWRGVDLPTSRRIIFLKLADHGDDDGRKAWPAVGRLAHEGLRDSFECWHCPAMADVGVPARAAYLREPYSALYRHPSGSILP